MLLFQNKVVHQMLHAKSEKIMIYKSLLLESIILLNDPIKEFLLIRTSVIYVRVVSLIPTSC